MIIGAAVIISNVFYKSIWVFFIIISPMYFYLKVAKKYFMKKREEELKLQFKDFCMSLVAQLMAGYSMENGMVEVYRELKQLYGEYAWMTREVKYMIHKIRLNITMEQCLEDFAVRTSIEDIVIFSEVVSIAKRTGGDMIQIVRDTATSIYQKIEVEREIQTIISGKKYEQMIMNVIPLGIVWYIRITSPEMFEVMYTTVMGRIIMTVCFIVYVLAVLIGVKISNIEV